MSKYFLLHRKEIGMRNPKTLENFYDTFKDIHIKYFPDFRPAQLWLDYLGYIHNVRKRDSFFCEYDELLEYLNDYVGEHSPYFKGGNLFDK